MTALDVRPASPERWPDLVELFGEPGVGGGCWCMFWRLAKRSDYEEGKGEGNRCALRELVLAGTEPGLVGYLGDLAVGWCAVAPREEYPGLLRSPSRRPRDDDGSVWSITCVYVTRSHRREGHSLRLVRSAIDFARDRGSRILEAYPVPPKPGVRSTNYAFTGFESTFEEAGFEVHERRFPTRPIMRFDLSSHEP